MRKTSNNDNDIDADKDENDNDDDDDEDCDDDSADRNILLKSDFYSLFFKDQNLKPYILLKFALNK